MFDDRAGGVADWPDHTPGDVVAFVGFTYSYIGIYYCRVPRATTTSDPFNAVAEPRRRAILSCLADVERSVGELGDLLRLGQPSVSKHLRVLRDVGLVRARRDGRHVFYRTDARALRPLYEWTSTFEPLWRRQLERVRVRAEKRAGSGPDDKRGTG